MRKTTLMLLAGAATLAATGPVLAQGRQGTAQDLARTTVQERAAQAFARLDANGDGKIDPSDREARQQTRFERLDANDDGRLNQADREARRKQMFARVDANGDGGISFEEFTARRGAAGDGTRAGRAMRGGPDGPQMAGRGMRGVNVGLRGIGRNADADGNGAITKDEFTSALLARFDAVDADKDGTVTAAERKAQRDSMRERMRERRGQRAG